MGPPTNAGTSGHLLISLRNQAAQGVTDMIAELTTIYLMVCPVVAVLVVWWCTHVESLLLSLVGFVVYSFFHVTTVGVCLYIHCDKSLVDDMKPGEYRTHHISNTGVEE